MVERASRTRRVGAGKAFPRLVVVLAVAIGAVVADPGAPEAVATNPPLTVTSLVTGLVKPWDVAQTPDGTILFTQKSGGIFTPAANRTARALTADFSGLFSDGETGLMGLVVDPDFATNRTVFTCQGQTIGLSHDIRVVPWTINSNYTVATRRAAIVTGIDSQSGRHGGCRLRFDTQKSLYISTGDAAVGTNPQDLNSLAGKVLRVTRSGQPVAGNITNGDQRIFTYGHRNPQGLALRPGTNEMWSVEHGPGVQDEVNRLAARNNYGWNPVPGYNESVPMTSAGATPAAYNTGGRTMALSGNAWLQGAQWQGLAGHMVVAALKDSQLIALGFDSAGRNTSFQTILTGYGRLRSPLMGNDGALYVTTSNGTGDQILRITGRYTGPEKWWELRDDTSPGRSTYSLFWGGPFMTSLACDVDGNGSDDLVLYDFGMWYVRYSMSEGPPQLALQYGGFGYQPVCGDWDGNGRDGLGVFDGSRWYLRQTFSPGAPESTIQYGYNGIVPVVGDWDGNGTDTIGVFIPDSAVWALRNSNGPGQPDVAWQYGFGQSQSIPVAADYDGNGRADLGVFVRGTWYIRTQFGPGAFQIQTSYGLGSDIPVPGDWNADGRAGVGVSRPVRV